MHTVSKSAPHCLACESAEPARITPLHPGPTDTRTRVDCSCGTHYTLIEADGAAYYRQNGVQVEITLDP